MAHFAQLDENNFVIDTIVIGNDDIDDTEQSGLDYIANELKLEGTWKKYSYNTFANKHWIMDENGRTLSDTQEKAFRGNYAETEGGYYDPVNDVFILPSPHDGFILSEDYQWRPPVLYPNMNEDGTLINPDETRTWHWDEVNHIWVEDTE